MQLIDSVNEKLKRHPKRIVFPNGDDPRVIAAARTFYERNLGVPILIGNRSDIERIAQQHQLSLERVAIINPEKSSDLPLFCERLLKLQRYTKIGIRDPREFLIHPNYFAAMMLQYGLADGLVGGLNPLAGSIYRPLMQLVKPLPHAEVLSTCMVLQLEKREFGDDGVLFFADCGVVPNPTMQQLASIAVETGLFARQVFGRKPRVALLSYSTKGTARNAETEKVAGAVVIARQLVDKLGAEIAIDGELQADTALVPEVASVKTGPSLVAGKANVLIFPDLNSGNIGVKLVQHLAGAKAYGQIVLGLSRPAADVPRGASVEDIVCAAAFVGLQAIEYRKLYPPEDETLGN